MDHRPLARDLTDAAQNGWVLDRASALRDGKQPTGEPDEPGGAVATEAAAAAHARRRLAAVTTPLHLSVVWAMYGETGRILPRSEHPHGEDFLREKVRQLDWLTTDLPVTWSIVAVDDGCPDRPSSAEVMAKIVAAEGYPTVGHRSVNVLRLAEVIAGHTELGPFSPAFEALTSTDQSRKGGSILAGLVASVQAGAPAAAGMVRHLICSTDADLSANLAQLGSLAAAIATGDSVVAALGQRYGMPGAVLVKPDGPHSEPHSTGGKPDKLIILFRHAVRAMLIPALAHVLDTQAGFKAFDAAALAPVLPRLASFHETFDVELLIRLAGVHGPQALAVEPIVFTEDFAATNFPSVDPGASHLAMVHQVVDIYDRLVAPNAPAVGEASALLDLLRGLDLVGYVRLIEQLRREDDGDPTLFDRRWPVAHLAEIVRGA
ncbi:MAG: hypothetical protein IPK24_14530 [Kineosporiaceae bacterium]|nr:hypothetical protein [Kineosporiaceae bacterium]MBK8076741.1 hypothetical protein [Kineosporiaceae bacterium]